MLGGAAGMVGDAVGADNLRDWGYDVYKGRMEQAAQYQPKVGDIRDVDSWSDAANWFMATLGQLTPTMAEIALTAIAGGGVAGLAGRKLAKDRIEAEVKKRVAAKVAEGVAEDVAKEAIEKQVKQEIIGQIAKRGRQVGTVVGSGALEGGGMYGETAENIGLENVNPLLTGALGVGSGLTELATPFGRVMTRGLGGEAFETLVKRNLTKGMTQEAAEAAAKKQIGGFAKRLPRKTISGMGQEGTQEGIQHGISELNANIQDPAHQTEWGSFANPIAAGAIVGGPFGALEAIPGPPKPAETTNEQDADIDPVMSQQAEEEKPQGLKVRPGESVDLMQDEAKEAPEVDPLTNYPPPKSIWDPEKDIYPEEGESPSAPGGARTPASPLEKMTDLEAADYSVMTEAEQGQYLDMRNRGLSHDNAIVELLAQEEARELQQRAGAEEQPQASARGMLRATPEIRKAMQHPSGMRLLRERLRREEIVGQSRQAPLFAPPGVEPRKMTPPEMILGPAAESAEVFERDARRQKPLLHSPGVQPRGFNPDMLSPAARSAATIDAELATREEAARRQQEEEARLMASPQGRNLLRERLRRESYKPEGGPMFQPPGVEPRVTPGLNMGPAARSAAAIDAELSAREEAEAQRQAEEARDRQRVASPIGRQRLRDKLKREQAVKADSLIPPGAFMPSPERPKASPPSTPPKKTVVEPEVLPPEENLPDLPKKTEDSQKQRELIDAGQGVFIDESIEATRKPQVVFRELRDYNGVLIGYAFKKYDGTRKGAVAAAKEISKRANKVTQFSNIASRIGSTDAEGSPKFVISPNYAHVSDVHTETNDARYTWGDPSARATADLILSKNGKPFTKRGAETKAKALASEGKKSEIVKIKGGYGVYVGIETDSEKKDKGGQAAQPLDPKPGGKQPWEMIKAEFAAQQKGLFGEELEPGVEFDDLHKHLVKKAFKEGKPIPPRVLSEYPDLKPKAPRKPRTHNHPMFKDKAFVATAEGQKAMMYGDAYFEKPVKNNDLQEGEHGTNPVFDAEGKPAGARVAVPTGRVIVDDADKAADNQEAIEAEAKKVKAQFAPKEKEADPKKKPTGQRRAKPGGEYGENGEWYEGGKFIANTNRPKGKPSKYKSTGRQQVGLDEWTSPPESGPDVYLMAVFPQLSGTEVRNDDGSFSLNPNIKTDRLGTKQERQAKIDLWNQGARWSELDLETRKPTGRYFDKDGKEVEAKGSGLPQFAQDKLSKIMAGENVIVGDDWLDAVEKAGLMGDIVTIPNPQRKGTKDLYTAGLPTSPAIQKHRAQEKIEDTPEPVVTGTAKKVEVSVPMPKAEEQGLTPREQKAYLMEEIDAAIKAAPDSWKPLPKPKSKSNKAWKEYEEAKKKALSKLGKVTIEVPNDGSFSVLNSKHHLRQFKRRAAKFPTVADVHRKDPTPSGRARVKDFAGSYYNPFKVRGRGVVLPHKTRGYVNMEGDLYSEGSYAVRFKKKPSIPSSLTVKKLPDGVDNAMRYTPKEWSEATIKGETYHNLEAQRPDPKVLVHVETSEEKHFLYDSRYVDSVLSVWPEAKAYEQHGNLYLTEGEKVVGLVSPFRDREGYTKDKLPDHIQQGLWRLENPLPEPGKKSSREIRFETERGTEIDGDENARVLRKEDGDGALIGRAYFHMMRNDVNVEESKKIRGFYAGEEGLQKLRSLRADRSIGDLARAIKEKALDQSKPTPASEPAAAPAPPKAPEKEPKKATPKKRKATKKATGKTLEDFGEKLGGARKDYAVSLRDATGTDPKSVPLSKAFPQLNYKKLIEEGVDPRIVAAVRSLRDEIPSKPRQAWKLRTYTGLVEQARTVALGLIDGTATFEAFRKGFENTDVHGRAELYERVGHDHSLKGYTFEHTTWGLYKGERNVSLWQVQRPAPSSYFGNMPQILAEAKTKEEALANFEKVYPTLWEKPKVERKTKFNFYSKRSDPKTVWIGKKVGRDYLDLKSFPSVEEARAFAEEHYDELLKELEKAKFVPDHRRQTNEKRTGKDHRKGKDVTPEMFTDAFGFRGVEFGNWVSKTDERQNNLNDAFDALYDLSTILGLPTQAISLNGKLGLGFGSRGTGGKRAAAAHYEPMKVVINLTRKAGAGSLAHEWWHALDNYFSRERGAVSDYMTEKPYKAASTDATRPEVLEAFKGLMRALAKTGVPERSKVLDKTRSKEYWTKGREMTARIFENYVIAKLKAQGFSNDYLANVASEKLYSKEMSAKGKWEDAYPYLKKAEIKPVTEAFDKLFKTVKTEKTDKGFRLYSLGELGFFSTVQKAIEAMDFKAMPPQDLLTRLKKTPGVKQEELDDLGLEPWLAAQEGKVKKADVLGFVEIGGPVLVEESGREKVEYGFRNTGGNWVSYETPAEAEAAHTKEEEWIEEESVTIHADKEAGVVEVLDHNGDEVFRAEYVDGNDIEDPFGQWDEKDAGWQYRQSWGEFNFRPELDYVDVVNLAQEKAEALQSYFYDEMSSVQKEKADDSQTHYEDWQTKGGGNYREAVLFYQPQIGFSEPFTGGHWKEDNVLVHYRFKDHHVNGQRVLLVEELQSDWHQTGRQKGYTDGQTDAADDALPDAPFKKSWPMLGFKRILRMATEEGYDAVAWTSGEIQADRYNLAKKVSKVYYIPPDKGETVYFTGIEGLDGKPITRIEHPTDGTLEELEPLYGKEITARMANREGIQKEGNYVLSGENLEVGGKGMKAFYDKILVNEAGKYLKKLDKSVKIEPGSLDNVEIGGVWTFPLTDKMKESIEAGQALYSKDPGAAGGVTLAELEALPMVKKVTGKEGNYRLHFKNGVSVPLATVKLEGKKAFVFTPEGRKVKRGWYDGKGITITQHGDKHTVSHELFHFMEDVGLITRKDRAILNKAAGKGLAPEELAEARARFIEQAMRDREAHRGTQLGAILQKIADFIDALVNVFKRTTRGVVRDFEQGRATKNATTRASNSSPETGMAFSSMPPYQTKTFKRWFGDSKAVNEDGTPKVYYHGTKQVFDVFQSGYSDGLLYFTPDPLFAEQWGQNRQTDNPRNHIWTDKDEANLQAYWAEKNKLDEEAFSKALKEDPPPPSKWAGLRETDTSVMPVYLKAENPFIPHIHFDEVADLIQSSVHKRARNGAWLPFENKEVVERLKRLGYDSIYLRESDYDRAPQSANDYGTLAVLSPNQVKSVFNKGSYDSGDVRIQYSMADVTDDLKDAWNETRGAVGKWGKDAQNKGYWKGLWQDLTSPSLSGDVSALSRAFSLISSYSRKVPGLQRTYEAAEAKPSNKFEIEEDLIHLDEVNMLEQVLDFKKTARQAYRRLSRYFHKRDVWQQGYAVVEDKEGLYVLVDLEGKPTEHESTDPEELWEIARKREATEYAEATGNKAAGQVLYHVRKLMDAEFLEKYRPLQAHVQRLIEDKQPTLVAYQTAEGMIEVDLQLALKKMGDRRGYYMPRVRESGNWSVYAWKDGKEFNRMETFDLEFKAKRRARELKAQGFKTKVEESKRPAEALYNQLASVSAQEAMTNMVFSRIDAGKRVLSFEDLGLYGHWEKDTYVLEGQMDKKFEKPFTELGGVFKERTFKKGRHGFWVEWRFDNKVDLTLPKEQIPEAKRAFSREVKGKVFEVKNIVNTPMALISEFIGEYSNTLKARGARSSLIERSEAIGYDVHVGFEEDLALRVSESVHRFAAGKAKQDMALNMILAMNGRDVSWDEFKEIKNFKSDSFEEYEAEGGQADRKAFEEIRTHWLKKPFFEDYQEFVEGRMIDPGKDKNAYTDAMDLFKHMLRNEEAMDRAVGFMKGLTVLKYLGFRPSAALINVTNMAAAVPAVIKAETGLPIRKTGKLIGKGMTLFTNYRNGKSKVPEEAKRIFDYIHHKGWDQSKFNSEALGALQSRSNRYMSGIIDLSMKMFGWTESMNRAATIYAVFQAQETGTFKEKMEVAHRISNDAHGVYTKANKPAVMRGGGIGANVLQMGYVFKTFSHNYLTTMFRLGFKERQAKAAVWMAMAPAIFGVGSAFGVKTLIWAVGSVLGAEDPEEDFYRVIADNFGATPTKLVRYGLPGAINIDLTGSMRIGIADLPTDLKGFLGAPGDVFFSLKEGVEEIGRGNSRKGFERIMPNAVGNVSKAFREYGEGITTRRNAPVFYKDEPLKANEIDFLLRFFSFNPARISQARAELWIEKKKDYRRRDERSEIRARVRKLLLSGSHSKDDWRTIVALTERYNARLPEGVKKYDLEQVTRQLIKEMNK